MSKILESEFRKELYKSLTEAGYEKKEAQAIVGKKYYEALRGKLKENLSNALDKVESICSAMNCTPNDMMEFIPDNPEGAEKDD